LADTPSDRPDMLATVTLATGVTIACIIEVKANWNDDIVGSVETQLADRYLRGPRGSTGVYVVGCYGGSAWQSTDPRRASAERWPKGRVAIELATKLAAKDECPSAIKTVLLDLTLDTDDSNSSGASTPVVP
jgi:hypothetical protein